MSYLIVGFVSLYLCLCCFADRLAMEIVGAVIIMIRCFCGETCSHQSISEKCMYMRMPHALANRLEEKMELLKAREEDVIRKLHVEKVWRGMEPKAEVNMWLPNVGKFKCSVACLQEEITKSKSCLNGCCPNYTSRLKLGKHFAKKIKEADRLLAQSIYPDASLVDMMPLRGNILPATSLVGETAQRSLKLACEYLNDGHTGIIGIYGMGGVGKTSILVAINN